MYDDYFSMSTSTHYLHISGNNNNAFYGGSNLPTSIWSLLPFPPHTFQQFIKRSRPAERPHRLFQELVHCFGTMPQFHQSFIQIKPYLITIMAYMRSGKTNNITIELQLSNHNYQSSSFPPNLPDIFLVLQ